MEKIKKFRKRFNRVDKCGLIFSDDGLIPIPISEKGDQITAIEEWILLYDEKLKQYLKSTILKKLPEENRGLNDDYRLGFNNCREKIKSLIDSL